MAKSDLDFGRTFANAIWDSIVLIRKILTHPFIYTTDTIFKRADLFITSKEYSEPFKEYPRLIDKQINKVPGESVLYYTLPIGMNFKKVENLSEVFESAFNSKSVNIAEIKEHKDKRINFSITIKDPS